MAQSGSVTRSVVLGCGGYLPDQVVTNDMLAQRVDTSDQWIRERTGIAQRHIAADGELTSDLAVKAAEQAIERAGIDRQEIDLVLVSTSTPDLTFPATATIVQRKLGIRGGFAFDVQAVCSGFVFGLATADNFIRAGQVRTVLLIGAETFSRILDWNDRNTCVLFGDGAGAVVLRAATGKGDVTDRGVLSTHLHTNGTLTDILYVDSGASQIDGKVGKLRMKGPEVFKHAVTNLADVAHEALNHHQLTGADIDWIVPHQANSRIIESTARKADVPMDRVILTVAQHGNTSAASIPLALNVGVTDGRIQPGQLLLIEAMGGGLAWGSALVRW